MGRIYRRTLKDGSSRYDIRYKLPDGTWKRECGGSLKKNAVSLLKRKEQEIAEGRYGIENISFGEFSDKWLSLYAENKVKASTYDDYAGSIRAHLKPYFGKSMLKNIRPAEVQAYVSNKINEGSSARTVNKSLTILKMMFKHAIMWGYLKENPARFVERPRQERKEPEFLTSAEVLRLLSTSSGMFMPLYTLGVMTGLRQGEIIALKWSGVDLQNGKIKVRHTWQPEHGETEPKSKYSIRTVDMSPELKKILEQYKASCDGDPDDLVFPNAVGKHLSRQNLLQRNFYPTLEAAEVRRVPFHALRHTYAALMIAAGANMKYLQQQMGHSSIRITLDLYGHLLPEACQGIGEKLDKLVYANNIVQFPSQGEAIRENICHYLSFPTDEDDIADEAESQ